jgi:inner membrane protein
MDLVTQGLLGATVGYAASSKNMSSKQALTFGAFFGALPDVDIVFKYFSSSPLAELFYHRGITHSIFFAPFLAFLVAIWMQMKKKGSFKEWFIFIFWTVLTHPLLDLFTTYGTQLLQPISNHRFSLNAVSIIDPLYSVPLFASIIIIIYSKNILFSRIFNAVTLFLTTAYLLLGVAQYEQARHRVLEEGKENKWCGHFEVFTGLFSIFERRAVFYDGDNVHIAHFSNLSDEKIRWVTFKQNELTIKSDDIDAFRWFSDGHLLIQPHEKGYLLRDLRFGIEPHPMDGLWGIAVDEMGKYISWEGFANLKNEAVKRIVDKFPMLKSEEEK